MTWATLCLTILALSSARIDAATVPIGSVSSVTASNTDEVVVYRGGTARKTTVNSLRTGGDFSGSFTGNGAGTTNVPVDSAVRYIALSPPRQNDTNFFGPWIPTTTTAGFQEAINSLPNPGNTNQVAGGTIVVGPGTFYHTATITIPTTNTYYLRVLGPGMLAGGTVYVGGSANNAWKIGAPRSINGAHISISDMFIGSTVNACTNIVYLEGYATNTLYGGIGEADFDRLWIGYWPTMTNSIIFSPDSAGVFTSTHRNLIGLNILNNFGSRITVRDCSFGPDVLGLSYANDQGAVEGNLFVTAGIDGSFSTTNDWPASTPYHMGFACNFLSPYRFRPSSPDNNNSFVITGNRFVVANRTIYYDQYNQRPKTIWNNMIEGNGHYATAGNRLAIVNPEHLGTATYYHVTNLSNFSSWQACPAPTNMCTETHFDRGLSIRKGGEIVVTNNGVKTTITSNTVTSSSGKFDSLTGTAFGTIPDTLFLKTKTILQFDGAGTPELYVKNPTLTGRSLFGVGPSPDESPFHATWLECLGSQWSGGFGYQLPNSGNISVAGTNGLNFVAFTATAPMGWWVGGAFRARLFTNGLFAAQSLLSSNSISANTISTGPGTAPAPTAITETGSPFSWTNTLGYNVTVYFGNVAGSLAKNGTTLWSQFGGDGNKITLPLRPGDYFTLTYTGNPDLYYDPL